tara:strand:- start:312 stop:1046 length:735 start_codon:yes stop_codon:yes gene_type:complete
MTKLFISDLHLHQARPEVTGLFRDFIDELLTITTPNPELYILGDLFEFWIGDDYEDPLYSEITNQLKNLVKSGIKTYLMHGNRDFLIGENFLSKTGIELLKEPTIFSYKDKNIMLSHGDQFCIDDIEYQAYRKIVRNREWQRSFLSFPIDKRLNILNEARDASIQSQEMKPNAIMDVNENEVAAVIQKNNIDILIHGHTHRPRSHTIDIETKQSVRLVLGDWSASSTKIIKWVDAEPQLIDLIN